MERSSIKSDSATGTFAKTSALERNRRKVGAAYERAAGDYLASHGYEILEYNYRCRQGEIDLVAKDGNYLVFCEVKYRRKGAGDPLEAVDMRKRQRLCMSARHYLLTHHIEGTPCRFDVIGIQEEKITLIRNAFEER